MTVMVWKVYCTSADDTPGCEWATNGVDFETREEALGYGWDLYSRWTGLKGWGLAQVEAGTGERRLPADVEVIVQT